MEIYYDPLFYAILLPTFLFLGMIVYCRKTGSPKFMRGLPLVRGVFAIKIIIKELRSNSFKVFVTQGRRFIRGDKTETYQTIKFGDIPAPKLEEIEESEAYGLVVLEKFGAGNYRILKTKQTPEGLEEERVSMGDRILWRDESRDSDIKYKETIENWTKLLPFLIIFVTALGIGIILWLNAGVMNDMSAKNSAIASSMEHIAGYQAEIIKIIYGGTIPANSTFVQNYSY